MGKNSINNFLHLWIDDPEFLQELEFQNFTVKTTPAGDKNKIKTEQLILDNLEKGEFEDDYTYEELDLNYFIKKLHD